MSGERDEVQRDSLQRSSRLLSPGRIRAQQEQGDLVGRRGPRPTMSFASGTHLGVYEITGLIGVGGMGEVYRATDTKLGREAAIKTLPRELASDRDRLARFEREAKLLASLNHPHIAAVYGLHEHEGVQFLAMELVEGDTLERQLKGSPLSVEDALRLALQVAEALEAAHEKGVVHRDLKPANIMVTRGGQIKVLDFGLAKAFSADPNKTTLGHSPALSLAMTQAGLLLGTAGYMSPEQASGQSTDQRADIWAFGVVLFEMLAGTSLFSGESVPHVLADVLKSEPDWSRLPKNLHPRLKLCSSAASRRSRGVACKRSRTRASRSRRSSAIRRGSRTSMKAPARAPSGRADSASSARSVRRPSPPEQRPGGSCARCRCPSPAPSYGSRCRCRPSSLSAPTRSR
jgi:serine/threonine protein kinase